MIDLHTRITAQFEESGRLKLNLGELLAAPIAHSAEITVQALLNEKKILACGNGGSASSAQYFASRMLNRYDQERPGLAAIALPADISTLTSIANDNHFEQVFARQVTALGHHGDILLALSTSGNSKNILRAIAAAKEAGMQVIAFSGGDGGELVELLTGEDIHIGVPHDHPARIQEVYILTLHCICDAIDCLLLGVN